MTSGGYATVYSLDGHTLSDGLPSASDCDVTLHNARRWAAERKQSVIVEDSGTQKCYRVTPIGRIWRAPKSWPAPWWEATP